MRSLEGIIVANAAAAGRECGHAENDGEAIRAAAIDRAAVKHDLALPGSVYEPSVRAYESARAAALREG